MRGVGLPYTETGDPGDWLSDAALTHKRSKAADGLPGILSDSPWRGACCPRLGVTMRVSRQTIIERVNAKLVPSGPRLFATQHGSAERDQFGAYYLLDSRGDVVRDHVSLPSLARRLGVLQDFETIAHEEEDQ